MTAPGLDGVVWPARTERLLIRPATLGDLDAIWRIRRRPPVSQWLSVDAADRTVFEEHFQQPHRFGSALVIEQGRSIIGDLMLRLEDGSAQREVADRALAVEAEIGWCISPKHAGVGLATEAVHELLRICFVELGLRRVVAECFAANESSWRLMERVGMRRETHTVRQILHRSGEWLDGYGYAILADEWR